MLSQAQELHLTETVAEIDLLYHKVCVVYSGHFDVLEAILDLVNLAKEIIGVSHKYDFRGIPANGFRSVVYKFVQLLRYMSKAPTSRMHGIMDIVTEMRTHAASIRQVLHTPVSEVPPLEIDRMADAVHYFATEKRIMDIIFNGVTLRFDIQRLGNFLTSFAFWFMSFVLSGSWFASLWCLFSGAARKRTVQDFCRSCPLNKLVHLLSYSRSIWPEYVLPFLAFRFSPTVRKCFQVPRQGIWKVHLDVVSKDVKLIRNEGADNDGSSIRCGLMRQNVSGEEYNKFDGVVLVYVHGGGFISNSVASCKSFLPRFCKKMPGLTIVTVGLSLAPQRRFPHQIQETLDVYLWLQSRHESVAKAIGFYPKDIMFSCDSSGALITMSTLVIMNDMNHLLRKDAIPRTISMPLSVIAHCPAFHVAPVVTSMPSLMLSVKDVLLFPTVITQMAFSYLPNISPRGLGDSTVELNHPKSCFLNPPDKTKNLLWRYEFVFKHPYYSPVYYDKLEELSEVQLHVLACHEDPLLDSSLLMMRRWRGPSSLHVLYTLRHAFFYFTSFSVTMFRSVRNRISEAEDIYVAMVHASLKHSNK